MPPKPKPPAPPKSKPKRGAPARPKIKKAAVRAAAQKALKKLPARKPSPAAACPYAAARRLAENSQSTIPVVSAPPTPKLVVADTRDDVQKELDALLAHRVVVTGDAEYVRKVRADLRQIYNTPTGKKLLQSLAGSGKVVQIVPPDNPNQGNSVTADSGRDIVRDQNGNPGRGSGSVVTYNPDRARIGRQEWETRPPAIGLAHELIHAEHFATGTTGTGMVQNDERLNPALDRLFGADRFAQERREEVETAGIPPLDHREFTENKIRAEWSPPQPARRWY